MSLPQIPAALTAISTSPGPGAGCAISSTAISCGPCQINACIAGSPPRYVLRVAYYVLRTFACSALPVVCTLVGDDGRPTIDDRRQNDIITQHTTRNMQHGTRNTQYAIRNTQYVVRATPPPRPALPRRPAEWGCRGRAGPAR